jgi:hypothetical protein
MQTLPAPHVNPADRPAAPFATRPVSPEEFELLVVLADAARRGLPPAA